MVTRSRINWPLPGSSPQPLTHLFLPHHLHWPYFKFLNEVTFCTSEALCTDCYHCLDASTTWLTYAAINSLLNVTLLEMPFLWTPTPPPSAQQVLDNNKLNY